MGIKATKSLFAVAIILILSESFFCVIEDREKEIGFFIRIDPRMELLSTIQILTDLPHMNQMTPFQHQYYHDVQEYFNPYRGHAAVLWFNKHRKMDWNGDTPVRAMLHLSDPPNIKLVIPFTPYLKGRAGGEDILSQMVPLLNQFVRDTHFMEFWKKQQPFYAEFIKRIQGLVPFKEYIQLITDLYGEEKAKYIFTPVPLFLTGGWGLQIETEEGKISFYIGGPHRIEGGFPMYNKNRVRYLVFHEFGHSFVNPIVHDHMDQINKYDYMYEYMQEDMAKLTYQSWEVTVFEHIVRAGETILLELAGFERESRNAFASSVYKGFRLLPQFKQKMELYLQSREKYPTFRSFFPEMLKVFAEVDTSKWKKGA